MYAGSCESAMKVDSTVNLGYWVSAVPVGQLVLLGSWLTVKGHSHWHCSLSL